MISYSFFKNLPFIIFILTVFDIIVLSFGIVNSTVSWFLSRSCTLLQLFLIFRILQFVLANFKSLIVEKEIIVLSTIYFVIYFIYGLIKIVLKEDTVDSTLPLNSCLWILQFLMVFCFMHEPVFFNFYKIWTKYFILVFLLFMLPLVNPFNWEIEYLPVCVLMLFWNVLKMKDRALIIILVLMNVMIGGQRSQIVRMAFYILIALMFYTPLINARLIKAFNLLLYIIPLFFLYLATFSDFNVFSDSGKFIGEDTEVAGENINDDTRTFLYVETIESSLDNGYYLLGRSPASGYNSPLFEMRNNIVGFTRLSEVCVLNVYTWTGVLGLTLFMCIYIYTSFRCLYKSNNRYMRMVGLAISISWLMNWFANSNYSICAYHTIIYMLMGLSLNDHLLALNDKEFAANFRHGLYGR